jgi:hypothetical protein
MSDDAPDLFDDRDLQDLRRLDPAHPPRPGSGRSPAAQAMLGRILEEPHRGAAATGAVRTRRAPRWLLVGAAAAAVTAGLIVLPPWGAPDSAFASWTAVPEELPVARLQEQLGELPCDPGTSDGPSVRNGDVVLAEERGDITFLVTATPASMAHCLLVDGHFHSTSWGGVVGPVELGPDEVDTVLAAGAGQGAAGYTAIMGRVGPDVVGVDVHPLASPDDPPGLQGQLPAKVQATVDGGYYGAWWPGGGGQFELTVHLADGSTIERLPAFAHDR